MTILAVEQGDVHIATRASGKGFVVLAPEIALLPGNDRRQQLVPAPFQPGAAGEIEGDFGKGKFVLFAVINVVANAVAWLLVAPSLDILIYAEPVGKTFSQGAFAAIANSLTAVIVGGLLVAAFCKTIAKKGSLDKE